MADLVVNDLHVRLGSDEVLKGVSVRGAPGEVLALLGPSGSGKTTFLRAVAGLATAYRGSIAIGETTFFDAARKIDLPAEARGLGLVFQSYALWLHRTVFDNVAYGLKLRNIDPRDINARVSQALAQIGLGAFADRYPHQLSGGQQQRVALARALVYEPALLLLDEPLSNLDARPREDARAWLRQLTVRLKLSVLIATRDQVDAMALADRIALLNGGVIEQAGSPSELYTEPKTLFAAEFMGSTNRLAGTLIDVAGERATLELGIARLVGRARTRAAPGEPATAVIRVEHVLIGGGPGPNRLPMTLATQMYLGERWELVFTRDAFSVRAYSAAPLKHEFYHVEFPPEAVWVF